MMNPARSYWTIKNQFPNTTLNIHADMVATLIETVEKPLILLVDDNLDNLELLRSLLEPEGYAVQAVDSGQAALEQMKMTPPI
jgi:PleD family two-component response regulator